jgi:hypothetical protein
VPEARTNCTCFLRLLCNFYSLIQFLVLIRIWMRHLEKSKRDEKIPRVTNLRVHDQTWVLADIGLERGILYARKFKDRSLFPREFFYYLLFLSLLQLFIRDLQGNFRRNVFRYSRVPRRHAERTSKAKKGNKMQIRAKMKWARIGIDGNPSFS